MAMATSYPNDYSNSCRLCLSKEGRQFGVFGPGPTPDPDDIGPLNARIFSCLSIDISQYDDLPKQICHRCECQINVWYYFKVECEASQKKLTAWLKAHPSSSSEKEACIEDEHTTMFQESVHIKLEPEDEEFPTDQHESGEADSSRNDGVLDQSLTYTSNESSNCLNLVISGTTTVDPDVHEGFSEEKDEPFAPVQMLPTSERTLDKDASTTKIDEINPNPSANAKGWLESEDSKKTSQEQSSALLERSFHVKSESKESESGDDQILKHLLTSSNSALSRSSRSLSPSHQIPSSTSTITSPKKRLRALSLEPTLKRPRLSENSSEHSRVQYSSIFLPKISNDVYDENSSTCKICVKSFSHIANLWRHIKTSHAQENPFRCDICRKDFSLRRELIAHRLGTINKYCRLGKKPELSSLITANPRIKYGNRGRYECSECKLKFITFTDAKAHERIHTGEKPFICYKCNEREFRLRKTALKHVTLCKGKVELQPQISQDNHEHSSAAAVTVPNLTLHNVVKKSLKKAKSCNVDKCSKCGKVFSSGVGLSNHLKTNCARKCISCLKFVPFKTFFKHYRQCFTAAHSSSALPEIISGEALNLNNDSADVKNVVKSESNVTDGPKAESSPVPRKLMRFDMTVREMWKKQLNEDGVLTLTCAFCGRTSVNRKSLHSHITKHSSKRFRNARTPGKYPGFMRPKLKCDICMKTFSSASSLEYHKLTHKKVKCEKCELTFPASMERTHLCTAKVKSESTQLSGMEFGVLPEKRVIQYTCHLCKKKFHTRKMLYQHKKMHIKVKIFKCKMCNNSYSDAGALKAHKEEDHKDEAEVVKETDRELTENRSVENQSNLNESSEKFVGKPLYCHVCQRGYSSEGSLDRHMKLHNSVSKVFAIQKPSNPGVFYCNICDKAFTSLVSFTAHKGWHSRSLSESTPKAEVSSDETPDLSKSPEPQKTPDTIEANDDESSLSFCCPHCPKKFVAQKNLRIHLHYHKNPKFQSPKETKLETVSHIENIHKCEICPSTFSDLSELSSHMVTHTEKSSDTLIKPSENDTPKQELLHCKLCNKEYKNKKNLNYHMMGHSGEKPYKCKSCSNQYSNPKALSKHEKERHAVVLRPFSCNRCKTSFVLREDLLAHQEKCPNQIQPVSS
ncbi:zinc finger protein 184-like [Thrips palmi]|uniref:Zinc finger protein 184-like n=1 Tax=Thrips palmi TaxID=161013 RepID=A0A6P9A452_THRPL|nr:zinc finger protein 184-like [Thrips palmi]